METEDADLKEFACERCDKIARAKKLPPGWKRRTADALLCAECLASGFDLRSIALPIQSVLPAEGEPAADACACLFFRANWR